MAVLRACKLIYSCVNFLRVCKFLLVSNENAYAKMITWLESCGGQVVVKHKSQVVIEDVARVWVSYPFQTTDDITAKLSVLLWLLSDYDRVTLWGVYTKLSVYLLWLHNDYDKVTLWGVYTKLSVLLWLHNDYDKVTLWEVYAEAVETAADLGLQPNLQNAAVMSTEVTTAGAVAASTVDVLPSSQ